MRKRGEKDGIMLDSTASFRELTEVLRRLGEEAEERVLPAQAGRGRGGKSLPGRGRRRPGAEQLRSRNRIIARIPVGEGACEVFDCGYAVYDNGERKTVLWAPDAAREAEYAFPVFASDRARRKHREVNGRELRPRRQAFWEGVDRADEERLRELPWYLAVVIAGENAIERNLLRSRSEGSMNLSDVRREENGGRAYRVRWSARIPTPEEECLRKEAQAERRAALTDRQREVYMLYYEENLTQREIAERLGISQKAVALRLEAANGRLRNAWEF